MFIKQGCEIFHGFFIEFKKYNQERVEIAGYKIVRTEGFGNYIFKGKKGETSNLADVSPSFTAVVDDKGTLWELTEKSTRNMWMARWSATGAAEDMLADNPVGLTD